MENFIGFEAYERRTWFNDVVPQIFSDIVAGMAAGRNDYTVKLVGAENSYHFKLAVKRIYPQCFFFFDCNGRNRGKEFCSHVSRAVCGWENSVILLRVCFNTD